MSVTRTRLSPDRRREQLLDLGVQLLAVRRLEDLSIDVLAEEAGISRGLLYHYFSGKRDFHLAVLRRMADEVIALTAPQGEGGLAEQLAGSLAAFVDFVSANHEAYAAFVGAAQGGDRDYHRIYEDARDALTGRIFEAADPDALRELGLVDTPTVRLMVRGWSALVQEVVLAWLDDPQGVSRAELLTSLTHALLGVAAAAPKAPGPDRPSV